MMSDKSFISKNKLTYNQIGNQFSHTRQYLWPELKSIAKRVKPKSKVLDLGCGNGRLLIGLPASVHYTGIDFSKTLIDQAKTHYKRSQFILADLLSPKTYSSLSQYDAIFSVAVLHHLPTRKDQLFILRQIHHLLSPDSFAYISVWNLLRPKFFSAHLHSLPLKLSNPRWLNIPFQHHTRLHFTFDYFYLKHLLHKANFKIENIYYTDENGMKTNWIKGNNLCAIIRK